MKDDVMYDRLKKVAQSNKYDKTEKFKRASKNKLDKIIAKKMNTTMIGALAKFENYFGEIWGHGLKTEQCSEEQAKEFEIWQQCRDEILNLGNSQIRAVKSELDLYNIEWKDSKINLTVDEFNQRMYQGGD